MAHSQLTLPYTCITPDYIPFEHGESLVEYAKRFAEFLLRVHDIDATRPLFICGYSLGAAIGIELTKYLPVSGLILIGGPMSSREIRTIPRLFGRYIAGWLPFWVYRMGRIFVAPVMRMVSGLSSEEIKLSRIMYGDLEESLFREAYRAVARWSGCEIQAPFIRIHGEFDHRVKCPKPGPHILIISKAKHMVAQARPDIVNPAIEDFIKVVLTWND